MLIFFSPISEFPEYIGLCLIKTLMSTRHYQIHMCLMQYIKCRTLRSSILSSCGPKSFSLFGLSSFNRFKSLMNIPNFDGYEFILFCFITSSKLHLLYFYFIIIILLQCNIVCKTTIG